MTSRGRASRIFVVLTAILALLAASCTSETGNPPGPAGDSGVADQASPEDGGGSDATEGQDQTVPADGTLPDSNGPTSPDGSTPDATLPPDANPTLDGSAPPDATLPPDASLPTDASLPDSSPPSDAADASLSVSATVGAAGATVQLASGARFVIPAGAVTSPLVVTLTLVAPPASGTSVGATVRVDPVAATLLVPAQISLPLTPALVPPDAAPSSLVVARSPDGVAPFVPVSSSVAGSNVTATTSSFGVFAAMLQPQSAAGLFITTASPLPTGTAGTPYSASFAATGGTPPYTWSVPSGSSAPPGLVLSAGGELAGTPTTAGKTLFFVLVTDSLAQSTQADFECDVGAATNPVPVLTSISPVSAPSTSSFATVVLTGSGFVPPSVAQFDGTAVSTTYSSSTQLVATVPTAASAAGAHAITVFTGTPGGGTSGAQTFTINAVPTLASMIPQSATVGSGDTRVSLFGTNFLQTVVGEAGGQSLATTSYYNEGTTAIDVVLPAALLATPGTLSITVVVPGALGGTSNALSFTVSPVNTAPTLSTVTPTGILVGSAATQITLTGTNFVASSAVAAGAQSLSTAYVSATELLAVVPAALLATSGTLSLTVANPPAGGTTSALPLKVVPPGAPMITSVSPSPIPAESSDTTITVTGTNFDATGRLYFTYSSNGQVPIHTTVTNSTTVTGVLKHCMLREQGTHTLVYAANAADASAPPAGAASAWFTLVIDTPADAGTTTCDPAPCSLGLPSYDTAVCENNGCCLLRGQYTQAMSCCSGLSVTNTCREECVATGPVPPNFGNLCCGDYTMAWNCY